MGEHFSTLSEGFLRQWSRRSAAFPIAAVRTIFNVRSFVSDFRQRGPVSEGEENSPFDGREDDGAIAVVKHCSCVAHLIRD